MARSVRRRTGSGMRVLVTGGTGFVGFHTVKALHEAGHEVRLLVRSPDKMRRVMAPFGLDTLEHVKGDIADEKSVMRALRDCDAVVHSAAAVNVRATDALETIRTNRRGTELVIGGAVEQGIDRIVQVSSSTALFNPGLKKVDENSPLGTQGVGYGRSKIEADLYVRGLQQNGACIYTTYPGSIMGPDDPGLSEAMAGLMTLLDVIYIVTTSVTQIVDVRDLAEAHVRLIERGGPPARYMMGGQYFTWAEMADMLEDLVGARLRRVDCVQVIRGHGRAVHDPEHGECVAIRIKDHCSQLVPTRLRLARRASDSRRLILKGPDVARCPLWPRIMPLIGRHGRVVQIHARARIYRRAAHQQSVCVGRAAVIL